MPEPEPYGAVELALYGDEAFAELVGEKLIGPTVAVAVAFRVAVKLAGSEVGY